MANKVAGYSKLQGLLLKLAAHATHFLIYALIIVIPLSGTAAWQFGIAPAGDAHETLFKVLLVLVAVHIAGALFQHFVVKSDVVQRMGQPERAG